MQQELFALSPPRLPVRVDEPDPSGYLPIYRVQLVRNTTIRTPRPQFRQSHNVADLLWQFLGEVDREHFVVILVDRKNRLIGIHTVSVGSLTASVVHPREVFKVAILSNAAAILCGHNHPSGDPQPSEEDRSLTRRLVQAGEILGIDVLDHVIIGDGAADYYSFADQGRLHTIKEKTMTDILTPIPHAVLSRVKWALGAIAQFNDAIRQCRAIEAHTGSAGRYEWEYRTGSTGQAAAAQAYQAAQRLTTFAERARQQGIDPEAVIAALHGETTPLPWSDAASAWLDDH